METQENNKVLSGVKCNLVPDELIECWWANLENESKRKLTNVASPDRNDMLWNGMSKSERREMYAFWQNNKATIEGYVGVL